MASPRRLGPDTSRSRERFVEAAEAVLAEVGAHAISARVVAARAGLKTQLLYYYFRTMDDLLLAVVQRIDRRRRTRFAEAVASPEPLRAMWAMMIDPSAAALAAEVSAVANHRAAVREEIVAAACSFRIAQTQAVAALLPDSAAGAAAGMVMMAAALARMVVNEAALGLTEGHREALAIVEEMIARQVVS